MPLLQPALTLLLAALQPATMTQLPTPLIPRPPPATRPAVLVVGEYCESPAYEWVESPVLETADEAEWDRAWRDFAGPKLGYTAEEVQQDDWAPLGRSIVTAEDGINRVELVVLHRRDGVMFPGIVLALRTEPDAGKWMPRRMGGTPRGEEVHLTCMRDYLKLDAEVRGCGACHGMAA